MKMIKRFSVLQLLIPALAAFFIAGWTGSAMASITDDIASKQKQIDEIQRQIDAYQQQIDENRSKASTLQNEINKLNSRIGQLNLQIKSLGYAIDQTSLEIQDTESKIADAEEKIKKHKQALAQYVRLAYETDQKSLTQILLNNATLSDFFDDLNSIQTTQDNIRTNIDDIKQLKIDLSDQRDTLQGKQSDLEKLKGIQEVEKRSLDGNKSEKNKILQITKGEESKYQDLVNKSKLDINRIREQIYYLEQNGISAEDAVKYGELAAIRAGIRPAFLLAILEIETRLGQNIGSGNWNDDMYQCYIRLGTVYYTNRRDYYLQRAETEKNAFFAIVNKLGLDPNTVKVSKEPAYGCGGAMGPAQFLPSTWLGYESAVISLTGHNPPSPWSIEDSFMASAIKLANAGATEKNRSAESAAARAYIGGSRACSSSICNYYANAVLNKAAEIESSL